MPFPVTTELSQHVSVYISGVSQISLGGVEKEQALES